jgi:putative transposase
LKSLWVPPDTRDAIVDFLNYWASRTELSISQLVCSLGVSRSKWYQWGKHYGKINEHNSLLPRDHWLEKWERDAIIDYFSKHQQDKINGYRRLTYMMLDSDIVAVSPTTVWRVLRKAGLLQRWNQKPSKKGTGFVQPDYAHKEWHIDVSYLNICGTFYYFCGVLDGYSRYVVHWEIRESMKEADIELILQAAVEKFPGVTPKVISDNGPQFIARDFKEFIRMAGMTHVRTSPYYPQSNGKVERWHQSLKTECIRPKTPLSVEDARRVVEEYIEYYNSERLHSAIGYITPKDKLEGHAKNIFAARDRKLEHAREQRRLRWQLQAS